MGRKRIQFSSTLKSELMDNLRKLSDNSGIPISKLLDQSIELLLDYYNKEALPYRNPIGKRTNSNKDEFDEIIDSIAEEDTFNTNQESKYGNYSITMDKIKELQKAFDLINENEMAILRKAEELRIKNKNS